MEIFHYLQSTPEQELRAADRIITNIPSENAAAAVLESAALNGRPVSVAGTDVKVMHIDTGTYTFPLLVERAIKMGLGFRIAVFSNEVMVMKPSDEILHMLGKANFAWASADSTFFVKFEGVNGWGLEPLGLVVENCKKLTKRLTEVLRCSGHFYYGDITMREFTTPEGDSDIFYDGGNAISEKFARRMGFKGTRGNIRVLTPMGLIKGDCLVVKGLDVDIVFHTENLKAELRTTDWSMATIMDHPPLHDARHDDQSRGNFSFFLTEDIVRGDLNAMVANYKESITNGGDLFDYLSSSSLAFDDPIAVDLERMELADTLEKQAQMLREVGIPPAMFSNITFTHVGALVRKMEANRVSGTPVHKKLFIPARNAFIGSVSTWEFCTKLCGMEFPAEDGSRTFFHSEIGLVIPGRRFEETYDLHGGHDGDDTWMAFAVKVFCSDADRLSSLIGDHVIDTNLVIGDTADEAVLAGLMIRRPNGPGEYSIECISEDMPWSFYNKDTIGTFDLAEAPMSQAEAFANTEMGEIPMSVRFDGKYDAEAALIAIQAQMTNPGVGTFANVLMAWAQTFDAKVVPARMIASMEDVVDTLQQMADPVAFSSISQSVSEMWVEFRDTVLATKTMVDPCLLATRIPSQVGSGESTQLIGGAIINAGLSHPSTNTRIQARYNQAIKFLRELSMSVANQTRNDLPMAQAIKDLKFGLDTKMFVENWLKSANGRLKGLDRRFRAAVPDGANALLRRQIATERRIAMEQLVDQMVDSLVSNEARDTHDSILAMYKWITTPRVGFPTGDIDRIFVQPGTNGVSMMHLFVEAVAMQGMLDS